MVAGLISLTNIGSEIAPVLPVTTSTQRPSTGKLTWISKKANPGNSATETAGTSNSMRCGSSSFGGSSPLQHVGVRATRLGLRQHQAQTARTGRN